MYLRPSVSIRSSGGLCGLALRHAHICPAAFLLPLVGRTDSAEGRARRGSPGIGLLVEVGRRDISRRGKRQAIRQASVPAADTAECFVDKALHARRPPSSLGLRPSRSSPTRGEGRRARTQLCASCSRDAGRGSPAPERAFSFCGPQDLRVDAHNDGTCRSRSVERMDEDFSVAGVMSRTGRRPAASGGLDP